jgi:hypothetical protein
MSKKETPQYLDLIGDNWQKSNVRLGKRPFSFDF